MNEENKPDIPYLQDITVKAATPKGMKDVPGVTHEWCPGLAITMCRFGLFEVTHIYSGMNISDSYERFGRALLTLSDFALIAKDNHFSWEVDGDQVKKLIDGCGDKPVPFDEATICSANSERSMTVKEWIFALKHGNFSGVVNEFPWEEVDPGALALENLCKVKGVEVE